LVRAQDIVARLGGGEFGFIMHGTSRAYAELVAEPVVAQLSALMIGDGTMIVGGGVGGTCSRAAATTFRALIGEADRPLYAAKRAARAWRHLANAYPVPRGSELRL
jgi:diguanylate cyclase (GGDEF)-like protein